MLDGQWYPVKRRFHPDGCILPTVVFTAMGKEQAVYIYYKNINRFSCKDLISYLSFHQNKPFHCIHMTIGQLTNEFELARPQLKSYILVYYRQRRRC